MRVSRKRYRVLVLGLRPREFLRLQEKADRSKVRADLHDGGHIGEHGSNCVQRAQLASDSADVVLLNVNGFRHLPSGFRKEHVVFMVSGVTDALRVLSQLAG